MRFREWFSLHSTQTSVPNVHFYLALNLSTVFEEKHSFPLRVEFLFAHMSKLEAGLSDVNEVHAVSWALASAYCLLAELQIWSGLKVDQFWMNGARVKNGYKQNQRVFSNLRGFVILTRVFLFFLFSLSGVCLVVNTYRSSESSTIAITFQIIVIYYY